MLQRKKRNWRYSLPAACLACFAAFLAAAGPVTATPWRAVNAETGRIVDQAMLEELARDFPDSLSVRLRLLNAYLEAEMREAALETAVGLVKDGYSFSEPALGILSGLEPSDEQREWLLSSKPNRNPVEASELLATVPAEALLVESVWRDPRSGDLFVSTVVSRALFVKRGDSDWRKLPIEGAGSLTGLAFDSERGLLWVASGVVDQTPEPETAFRGLIALDPASGEVVRRVAGMAGANPSDIAVGPDGQVFASDPLSGAIYTAMPAEDSLRVLLEPGTLRSTLGIAVLPDGQRLVVSDYRYGLALVDYRTGHVSRVTTETMVFLDGIDGLWLRGDRLIGIQNGSSPMRIVDWKLDQVSGEIGMVVNREVAHPAWTEPLGGNLDGDTLIYVANGQWDRFGEGGALREGAAPEPTAIRSISLPE